MMQQRTLIAGVAALFLATGTTHAQVFTMSYWKCGNINVALEINDTKQPYRLALERLKTPTTDFRIKKRVAYLNGKRCQRIQCIPDGPEAAKAKAPICE
jgi:hypothetical protein